MEEGQSFSVDSSVGEDPRGINRVEIGGAGVGSTGTMEKIRGFALHLDSLRAHCFLSQIAVLWS